ncbi:MAG: hypothetical protein J6V15_06580, partial [Clostridia bacterium]|nr:hypothetical protein [Clostridia bacterium]
FGICLVFDTWGNAAEHNLNDLVTGFGDDIGAFGLGIDSRYLFTVNKLGKSLRKLKLIKYSVYTCQSINIINRDGKGEQLETIQYKKLYVLWLVNKTVLHSILQNIFIFYYNTVPHKIKYRYDNFCEVLNVF